MLTRSQRTARRPAKRWEDVLNEFVKDEETQTTHSNDLKNNHTWSLLQKIYEQERKENNTRSTVEEPNSSQHHHDDIPPARSPALTTAPAATEERMTAKTQCSSPGQCSRMKQYAVFRGIRIYAAYCILGMLPTRINGPLTLTQRLSCFFKILHQPVNLFKPHRICHILLSTVCVPSAYLDTLSIYSVFGDFFESTAFILQSENHVFRGVMTPSLTLAGPDAEHLLDPPSMSVVLVQ